MKIVKGNKTENITKNELNDIVGMFEKAIIDIGTGDGRFVHKSAIKNSDNLYIGIDPSEPQLKTFSKKSVKEKLENALYVVGSIELIPEELFGTADEVIINFPWGSLLSGVAKAEEQVVENIKKLLKPEGKLTVTFGYSEEAEPSETERLSLEEINLESLEKNMVTKFEQNGFELQFIEQLEKEEIFEMESSWAKRLKFGQERKIFQLIFVKK